MWKEKFSKFVYWTKFTKKLLYSWIVETSVRYCIFSCDKYLIPTKSILSFWLLCDNSFDYSFEKLYCHTIKISKHTTSDRRPISPIDERSEFLESKFSYKMLHKCSRYSPENTKFKGDIIDYNWLTNYIVCLSDLMLHDFSQIEWLYLIEIEPDMFDRHHEQFSHVFYFFLIPCDEGDRFHSWLLFLPPLESWDLPGWHLPHEPAHILSTHRTIDDHLHLFQGAISTKKLTLLIAERAVFCRLCTIFFCSASFWIFFERYSTGLALDFFQRLDGTEEIFHEAEIRE